MEHLYEAITAKLKKNQHISVDAASPTVWTHARVLRIWDLLTISFGYKFAIRSFSGDTFIGSRQEGSVESMEQSGRMMSEPTQS